MRKDNRTKPNLPKSIQYNEQILAGFDNEDMIIN
jgi:hypothetical protein